MDAHFQRNENLFYPQKNQERNHGYENLSTYQSSSEDQEETLLKHLWYMKLIIIKTISIFEDFL